MAATTTAVAAAAAGKGRAVLVAGASGLVGREVLAGLLADESVTTIHTLGRRELPFSHFGSEEAPLSSSSSRASPQSHSKLHQHIAPDFASRATALLSDARIDEVYLALGTTIKIAGSREAFSAVDLDANLAVARAARAAGATRCGVVSAMGADANSRVFYSRIKGELEDALGALGFTGLVIARPSLLAGDRASLGQPERMAEKLSLVASRLLAPLMPAHYKPVAAKAVAEALRREVPVAVGRRVLLSGRLQIENF